MVRGGIPAMRKERWSRPTGLLGAILMVLAISFGGCMVHPLVGTLYTDVTFHAGDYEQMIGKKSARACSTNILGIIAVGDASVVKAAKGGGISKVTSVDYKMTNILGLFGSYCVVITGE